MSDNVLDFLRAQFARMDDQFDLVNRKLDELTFRVGALETTVALMQGSLAHLSVRMDGFERWLERVERRLDLRESALQA